MAGQGKIVEVVNDFDRARLCTFRPSDGIVAEGIVNQGTIGEFCSGRVVVDRDNRMNCLARIVVRADDHKTVVMVTEIPINMLRIVG